MTDVPGFTCHHCGMTSRNPSDVEERYCGWCHHFCDAYDFFIREGDRLYRARGGRLAVTVHLPVLEAPNE
jgi:hypothetical protein